MLRIKLWVHPFLLGHGYYYNLFLGVLDCFYPHFHTKRGHEMSCFVKLTRNLSLRFKMGSLQNILWFAALRISVIALTGPL